MPTTLLEFAQAEVDRYETLLADSRTALADAQSNRRDLHERLRERSADLDRSRRRADALRRQLADVPTRADGEPLLADLEEAQIAGREANARILEIRLELLDATVREERAADRIRRAEERLTERRREKDQAEADRRELTEEWDPLLADPPLSDLPTRAEALVDDADSAYHDLKQALEDAIPEELRTSTQKRLELERTRRSNAEKLASHAHGLLDADVDASGDAAARFAAERTAYVDARRELERYIRRAATQFEAADELMRRHPPELPEGAQERLTELESDGATAAGLEVTVTEARITVSNRTFDLEKARLDAAADPDADPDAVTDAEAALASAEGGLTTARGNFETDDHPENLEKWQLAVPEAVWRFYLRFLEAERLLDRLANDVDPGTLRDGLNDAEEALAGARADAADARARRDELDDERRDRETRLRGLDEVFADRAIAAVRGDG